MMNGWGNHTKSPGRAIYLANAGIILPEPVMSVRVAAFAGVDGGKSPINATGMGIGASIR
jgi:hypothetical protein